jgi:hypothetical protein
LGVDANKTLLAKFKQQRVLEVVALGLGFPGVHL